MKEEERGPGQLVEPVDRPVGLGERKVTFMVKIKGKKRREGRESKYRDVERSPRIPSARKLIRRTKSEGLKSVVRSTENRED